MKRRLSILALALCSLACSNDSDAAASMQGTGSGSPDGGASDARDANTMAQADAGPLVWMPTTRPLDEGSSIDGRVDAATPADPRSCAQPRRPLQPFLLPRCSDSTRVCIDDCAALGEDADDCRDACLEADDVPAHSQFAIDCAGCVFLQLFACISNAGCEEGVAQFFCCAEERCPAGSPEGCAEQQCGSELRAALMCGYFADQDCLDLAGGLAGQCYAPGDTDAGL